MVVISLTILDEKYLKVFNQQSTIKIQWKLQDT